MNFGLSTFMATENPSTKMHRYWWTALPAIPSSRLSLAYRRLKRQFADHTMNTWTACGDAIRPGGRGFYVEGREDHLVPAFFEDFSLFPDFGWFEDLLRLADVPTRGAITRLAWSYSYESRVLSETRPRIADVVFMWEDRGGKGVLVVEAKKAMGNPTISEKDLPQSGYYLQYQAFHPVDRRHQVLLVGAEFAKRALAGIGGVLTWQQLADLKLSAAMNLTNPSREIGDLIQTRLRSHHHNLHLTLEAVEIESGLFSENWQHDLTERGIEREIRDWLVGSETYFAARCGILPKPPFEWLAAEGDAAWWRSARLQKTSERELPLWRLA
jgi:hypothetical protein